MPIKYHCVSLQPSAKSRKRCDLSRVDAITNSTWFFLSIDSVEAGCLPDAETSQEVVLSAMERYCKTRFPDETFRFGKILLKLMGLRAVNAKDLEFLFFSKLLQYSSIADVIRNHLVSDLPSPVHRMSYGEYKEASLKSTCQ